MRGALPVDLDSQRVRGLRPVLAADPVDRAKQLGLGKLGGRAAPVEPAAGVDHQEASIVVLHDIGRVKIDARGVEKDLVPGSEGRSGGQEGASVNRMGIEMTAEIVIAVFFPEMLSPVAEESSRRDLSPAYDRTQPVARSLEAGGAFAGGAIVLRSVLAAVDPVRERVVPSPDAVENRAGPQHVAPGREGELDRVDSGVADDPDVRAICTAGENPGRGSLRGVNSVASDKVVAEDSSGKVEQAVGSQPGAVLVGPAIEFHITHDLVATVGDPVPIGVLESPEIGR